MLNPEQAEKLDKFIQKLWSCRDGLISFTFVLDDISGNSYVENPLAPKSDDAMTITKYERTKEQNQLLGLDETRGNYHPICDSLWPVRPQVKETFF